MTVFQHSLDEHVLTALSETSVLLMVSAMMPDCLYQAGNTVDDGEIT